MKKKVKLTKAQLDHKKFLDKMGVSKEQLKERKKSRKKDLSVYNTSYGKRYYDDKPNGGIVYDPLENKRSVETEDTLKEIERKKQIGQVLIDSSTGPRDLDYPVKQLPKNLKL